MKANEYLTIARQYDHKAQWANGGDLESDGCLLVRSQCAQAIVQAIPGSWEDPNEPPLTITRVIVPAPV